MEESAKKSFIINVVFIFLWVLIILTAGKFLLQYMLPFVFAICVAAIMQKPAKLISKKIGIKKGICAAVLASFLYIAVGVFFVFLVLKTFNFLADSVYLITNLSDKISHVLTKMQGLITRIFNDVSPEMADTGKKFLSDLLSTLSGKISSFLSEFAAKPVKAAPAFVFSSLVALVSSCYIAKDFDGFKNFIKGIVSPKIFEKCKKIVGILKSCVLKMLAGYLILMLITFIELVLGLVILRVENAVPVALTIAIVDVLPVLGAGTVLLPWGFLNVVLGNTGKGIGVLILYLLITVIRNFLEPKIVGEKMGIHPLFLLLSMFLGLRLFGFFGLVILPVTFIVVIKYYKSEMDM